MCRVAYAMHQASAKENGCVHNEVLVRRVCKGSTCQVVGERVEASVRCISFNKRV